MLANNSINAGFAGLLSLCILVNAPSTANAFFDDDLPDPYAQRSDASGRSVTTYAQLIEQRLKTHSRKPQTHPLVTRGPGARLNLRMPQTQILILTGNIAVSTLSTLHSH